VVSSTVLRKSTERGFLLSKLRCCG